MSYESFARYYDALMQGAAYPERAEYLCQLLLRWHHAPGITLDLACGTGNLTLELRRRGFDVYGVDASPDMLACAQAKAAQCGQSVLFLCQKMQELDLYGTVDTVFCTLDSLNHLPGEADLRRALARVFLFLSPGGLFVFDMNTPYKHREVLGDHTFVYDTPTVYCVWQNHYMESGCRVHISLDFFEQQGQLYQRSSEQFYERAYPTSHILQALREVGFSRVETYAEQSFTAPGAHCERIVYAAQKPCSPLEKENV